MGSSMFWVLGTHRRTDRLAYTADLLEEGGRWSTTELDSGRGVPVDPVSLALE